MSANREAFKCSVGLVTKDSHIQGCLLEGSWDLVTRVVNQITFVTRLITPVRALTTLLAKSPDPPSRIATFGVLTVPYKQPTFVGFLIMTSCISP